MREEEVPDTPRRTAGLKCEDARLIARDVLAVSGLGERLVNDVLLVVSELVSNADRHAGGASDFRVRPLADCVVVEVSDRSPASPRTPGTPLDVPGGFGWLLVNRIADRTEIRPHGGGKTITAFIPLPATP
ncbi:ATP-binding protein [Streptomyces sp. ISL-66]|uniref:ATP-binding protein n=1 Tax=Streptomyces sp. ISL-66 TaxID=2819186 RepID=UPI001BE6DDD6|nr:ATP-binding protein [Streptomyces sp. ISL-66]MBT2468981.1 ATP-binding protein [Streptomyces sp. ISL-66]